MRNIKLTIEYDGKKFNKDFLHVDLIPYSSHFFVYAFKVSSYP